MAIRNKNSVNEILRKSIGGVTYYQCKGQSILRGRIMSNPSKTPLQQRQRKRWPEYSNLADACWDGLLIGFPGRPQKQSAYNAFVHANKNAVSIGDDLEVSIDYEKVVCSQGKVTTPMVIAVLNKTERSLQVTPQSRSFYSKRGLGNDKVYLQIVEKSLQEGFLTEIGTREETTPVEMTLPVEWNMDELALYVFATTANGRKASKTTYVVPTTE